MKQFSVEMLVIFGPVARGEDDEESDFDLLNIVLRGGFINMKIKEQTIKELESLNPSELTTVYEMIVSLKRSKVKARNVKNKEDNYLKVRELLSHCKGALSEDIKLLRGDRI